MSVLPPGPNGTMTVTGWLGQSTALAACTWTRLKNAHNINGTQCRRGIATSLARRTSCCRAVLQDRCRVLRRGTRHAYLSYAARYFAVTRMRAIVASGT